MTGGSGRRPIELLIATVALLVVASGSSAVDAMPGDAGVDPGFWVCPPPWDGDPGFSIEAPPWPGDSGFWARRSSEVWLIEDAAIEATPGVVGGPGESSAALDEVSAQGRSFVCASAAEP